MVGLVKIETILKAFKTFYFLNKFYNVRPFFYKIRLKNTKV